MAITKTLNCKVDEEYKPTEIEWGIPTGEEIWYNNLCQRVNEILLFTLF